MKAFKKGPLSQIEITQWLRELRQHAYVPESNFIVTAIFRARIQNEENYYFGGVNVENVDHRMAIHAEENSLAGIVTGLGKSAEIIEGWVMGAPKDTLTSNAFISCCGKCRQQIVGLSANDVSIHFVSLDGEVQTTTTQEFLPNRFSFRDMNLDIGIDEFNHFSPPTTEMIENRLIRRGLLSFEDIRQWLSELQSIDYISKVSQTAVIRLDNGFYVAGTKIEEAAFQSITAPQSAVAIATTEFGERNIEEVFVYTYGRDHKKLPPHTYGTLSLCALQTILQTATHPKISIHFFNESSKPLSLDLLRAAGIAPSSKRFFYKP